MRKLGVLLALVLACGLGWGQAAEAGAPPQTSSNFDPRTASYNVRLLARAVGNVGGWWSFMSEEEKTAFVDGFWQAMHRANEQEEITCEVLHDSTAKDPQTPVAAMLVVINVCSTVSDTSGYENVTIQDLDRFYLDPTNQPIPLEWTMPYLRDKATGRKTKGQLLDALDAEQKDVHDCTKYSSLCKLGLPESQPAR